MSDFPRISFGIIVLNGEPFVRYNLRALYPFAYEIIVVEGAVKNAAVNATEDGHSLDSTLEKLQEFKEQEDPDDKLIIVTRDGFWDEKDAMSQAYAEQATGDYLWQIDADEFYLPQHIEQLITMLRDDPTITQISFMQYSFWGSPDYISDGWFLRRKSLFPQISRIFKWGAGYRYTSHRPPTIVNERGETMQHKHWIDGFATKKLGIRMYHYALVFPKQVEEKSRYYKQVDWTQANDMLNWMQNSFITLKQPFRVHNVYEYPSWLERFTKPHPPQIQAMWDDIQSGKVVIETRDNADVEALLKNPLYILLRFIIKHSDTLSWKLRPLRRFLGRQRLRVKSAIKKVAAFLGVNSPQDTSS
jgi:glycosyltransferase involved in cell wall biosynthesis